MKKIRFFTIFCLLGCLITGITACNKPAPEEPEKPEEKPVAVASVSVEPASLELVAGEKATIKATVLPADASDSSVSWSSSDASVATVSESGAVTAVAAGHASITVTTTDGAKKATCAVTVTPAHVNVKSVLIDPVALTLETGQSATLAATVQPEDASDPSVIWSSSDESIATVSDGGLVNALSIGEATITVASVEDGSKKAECVVEVVKPSNVIWYKSYQDALVEPYAYGGIGHPVSNSFVDGWGELVFEHSIRSLGEKAFQSRTALTEMVLPARVESIGENAFNGCSSLVDIHLPEGLVSLGASAFYGCYSLKRIVLPTSLSEIGSGAFSRCGQLEAFESALASADGRCLVLDGALVAFAPSGLTEYIIPAGVRSIAPSVMKYCVRLESVTIPATVGRIGDYAFYNCSTLRTITLKGTTPPELGENAFLDVDKSFRIVVPSSAISSYVKADGWKNYASHIVAE